MFRPALIIAMFAVALFAGLMSGGVSRADPFGGAAPVSADALQSERAGFTANGETFGFTAALETLVNGQLALVTTLTLLDDGSVTKQSTAGSNGIPVSNAATLAAALSGTGVNVNGLSATGVVIKSSTGVTAVLDSVEGNQLQNLVINTASKQNIVQNTTLTITLPAAEMSGMQTSTLMNAITGGFQSAQIGH
jgi:hypothetical protein